jgi:hypothetical protein
MSASSYSAAATAADPFAPPFLAELRLRQTARAPKVQAISRAELGELANTVANRTVKVADAPAMRLTARQPYTAAGFMDVYKPGRWDCESDLVFMDVIVSGPSPGEWDGTAVYGRFQAPAAGNYLVVGTFSGYQITMNLGGPWGTNSAYCPTTSDTMTVSAFWPATAGETLSFGLSCTGPILGYLESIQVISLS